MSSLTATRTEPTVTPRVARRFGHWFQLALLAVVLTGLAVLAVDALDVSGEGTTSAAFDVEAVNDRLVSLGYLTPEGVHEYETTRDLQNRGLVPTAPTVVDRGGTTEQAETRRLVSRGLVPAGTNP